MSYVLGTEFGVSKCTLMQSDSFRQESLVITCCLYDMSHIGVQVSLEQHHSCGYIIPLHNYVCDGLLSVFCIWSVTWLLPNVHVGAVHYLCAFAQCIYSIPIFSINKEYSPQNQPVSGLDCHMCFA